MHRDFFCGVGFALVLLAAPLGAWEVPALTTPATGERLAGKIVWADLFASDPPAAVKFYTGLFGWTAETIGAGPESYVVLRNGDQPVAGIARRASKSGQSPWARWVLYASVEDVAGTVARAKARDGRVLLPAQEFAGRGVQAVLADAQRAVIGIVRSRSGDPPDFQAEVGEWNWATLFARDPVTAGKFYAEVAGYEVVPDERTERTNDFVLVSGGYARASIQPLPDRPGAKPAWLGFVRVADVERSAARATDLGGRILRGPKEPAEGARLRIAIVADPLGAAVGLVELLPLDEAAEDAP